MKRTKALQRLAVVLMSDPDGRHYGYQSAYKSGLRSGVIYPQLHRMLDEGWLTDGWEETPAQGRRTAPPRRYYKLTELGRAELGALARSARASAGQVRRVIEL